MRVNVVSPGYIDVRGVERRLSEPRHPTSCAASLVALDPARPRRRAHRHREAVLFLCSDAAAHVSGAVLDVDGGSLAGRFTLLSEGS